jgi:enoyl-CoA hydratase/carnithine racemase
MSDGAVHYALADGVATIVMDRPEAKNALNRALREGLWDAFRRFVADDTARVAVLASTGDVFSAGADLKEMAALGLRVPPPDFLPQLGRNLHTDKPVIAAVQGPAYAGGFALAQMCDLCVAADDARFAITEAKWSRGAPWAAPLPWLIPPRIALELIVTAEPLTAERAREIGLVNRVVPRASLLAEAQALAATIAKNAPLSVRAAKRMVYAVAGKGLASALDEGDRIWQPVYESEDAQEGPRAFREKRAPVWRAR